MSRRNKKNRKHSKICTGIIIVCILLLAGIVLYTSADLREKREVLEAQAAELEIQIENAKAEYEALEAQEEYMQTKKFVEDVARNQLGLVYPDEIVIRPEQ